MHLLEGWRLIEGGHLLISFSDSAAVEAQKKNIDKVAKESGFLRIPRGGA